MNKTLKKLFWPLIQIRRWHDAYLIKHNPEQMFSIWHKRSTGVPLNIDNPRILNEKIAYMSFRTDTSEWTRLADKVGVRNYVEECGYGDCLPKLYGTWEHASDIDFSKLPEAFVIKTNNGSATNILIRDKNNINEEEVRNQLDKWMRIDYGYRTCQPHYSRIKPLILAEEFLDLGIINKSLNDYKFYCCNGVPYYCFVYTERVPNTHIMKCSIYDMEWNAHPEFLGRYVDAGPNVERPRAFEKMKEMAKVLSSPFPFVRVDFYEVNEKPVFGEMTFTPGYSSINLKFENLLGDKIKIRNI